ncbi:MAG: phosphoribosyltransferase domain-containing protein [Spirochaetes bacterium]|nr:phosphoribosyltransferase domain-containing protein [Spirochaetota bacterium]MBU1079635.1 phosphoribosyltransferase domain-containing protein [Spirochaetota bacterium]
MIDDFLFCDWDEAPDYMDFELPYGEVVGRSAEIVAELASGRADPGAPRAQAAAKELFVLAPAIVNVALNHSVCVQFGLPLHPTEYFELAPGGPAPSRYGREEEESAFELLKTAIALARAAYRLDPRYGAMAAAFRIGLPHGLAAFVYTSRKDKYTWRAAEPAKVRALSASVLRGGRPSLAVGAAHGSIMAGLFLAELLECELWFLRFSMFKRNDKEPVVSALDEEKIRSYGDGSGVLVFDEDSASGTTLALLSERVKAMAPLARTGAVIRHQGSAFKPDHVGKTWWD